MRGACVLDVKTEYAMGLGHEPLDAVSFERALDALEEPRAVDAGALARCNARVEREIAAKLADAATRSRGAIATAPAARSRRSTPGSAAWRQRGS